MILRTPLTRMKLQLSLMKNDSAKSQLEYDIKEMTAMLNSYVNFVKGEAPEKIEFIQINELIDKISKDNQSNNCKITYGVIKKVGTSGRPLQIKRAIQNIIDNAKRYATQILIEIYSDNEKCSIYISDNGSGIPERNYEDVFKPFFTLDPSRNKLKGESGLGMTISRDIIRSHGGDIKLSKSSIGGLKIKIDLPL